jgi:phosphosulfolactate synthase
MDATSQLEWHPLLKDPTGRRQAKPRTSGKTMVIDKGLGLHAFEDLLQTAASHIDIIKIGFGTSPLYPLSVLKRKIELASHYGIDMMPGGTFLEVAVSRHAVDAYFEMIQHLGYSAIEVSDGTIELDRALRSDLIRRGADSNLTIYTEYGKKYRGSQIELEQLIETVLIDLQCGASLVTIEARESGEGVGIFDENGVCRDDQLQDIVGHLPDAKPIMWEAPQKSQQIHLLTNLGADVNLGNIAPQDVFSLESLRRGLRSDTFAFG